MNVKLPLLLTAPVFLPLPPSLRSDRETLLKAFFPGHSSASVQAWLPSQLQMKSASPCDGEKTVSKTTRR